MRGSRASLISVVSVSHRSEAGQQRGDQVPTASDPVSQGRRSRLGGGVVHSGAGERFLAGRLAASALVLAGSTAVGATWGPPAAGVLVLAAALLPRRFVSVVAAEFGVVLGWVSFHPNPARWALAVSGSLGLLVLVAVRCLRGRAPVTEPRSFGLGLGLVTLLFAGWVPIPHVGAAVSWLVLSGWVLAVYLALLTEGFTPLSSLRGWGAASVRERAFGRGSVTRNVVAAAAATCADFSVFHALLVWLPPALATLLGCVVGGAINFSINRGWAFDTRRTLPAAAMRYVWVSAASAAFNTIAVAVALLDPTVSPVAAWVVARALGFLGWNYPMQRDHVFAHGHSAVAPVVLTQASDQRRRAGRW